MSAQIDKHSKAYFRKYLHRFYIGVLLLITTIVSGIVGFMVVSDYTFMEAYYMTIITLASVGYNEVKPLDASGQLFASILILFNMGIFAYAITSLSVFLVEGEFGQFLKHKRLENKIKQLNGHTIVCGYGRHGRQIVDELKKNQQPFVVVQPKAFEISELNDDDKNILFVDGDATKDDVLVKAGVHRAKAIVITFGEDAFNVYAVLTARQLNPHIRIISRASDHYADQKLRHAGADYIVRSELIGGFYMATLVHQPHVVEFFTLLSNMGSGSIHFREVEYRRLKPEYRDKTLRDLSFRGQTGVNIIGLRFPHGKYVINPNADTLISQGTTLVLLGDMEQIKAFETLALSPL